MQGPVLSAFWIQSSVNSVRQHKINMIEYALTLSDRTHEESAKVELRKLSPAAAGRLSGEAEVEDSSKNR